MKQYAIAAVLIWLTGCTQDDTGTGTRQAVADVFYTQLNTDSTYSVTLEQFGQVTITQAENGLVTFQLKVVGQVAQAGKHAVHLHEGTCEQPGMHWNQGTMDNFCNTLAPGEPWARPKAGDIGNITIDAEGNGSLEITSSLWSLETGIPESIVGKVVYVHQDFEDFAQECFESHTHIHKNPKIACAIVNANP